LVWVLNVNKGPIKKITTLRSMSKIFLATRNKYKEKQFSYLLKDTGIDIVTITEYGFKESPDEDGLTARENALLKARFWVRRSGLPTLADDAGLEVDALNGEPGVKARRWGGRFPDDVSDEEWLDYLLERMKGIPFSRRTALYRAAWALVLPNKKEYVRDIKLKFIILKEPKRGYSLGSPMSAVRYFPEYGKVENELTEKEQWEELYREMKGFDIPSKIR